MASYYLDTSALVKRYLQEAGTNWVVQLTDPAQGHDLSTGRLTGPELVAAIVRKVNPQLTLAVDVAQAIADVRFDWDHQYQIVEMTAEVADRAMRLAEHHRLRGYDAIHLAAALLVRDALQAQGVTGLTFISADLEQATAARAEGLLTDDPNTH
jgi:predicted nucleic acid-binding protein